MNTNIIGNMTESVILSEFQKNKIPVSIPFGRNEPYDFVIETKLGFKSIQVKHGIYKNGCVIVDMSHKKTYKKNIKDSYKGVVDCVAIWCSELNKSYLIDLNDFVANKSATLRIEPPKRNNHITKIKWATDYELNKMLLKLNYISE